MKMTRRLSKRLRRFALFCFMAAATSGSPSYYALHAASPADIQRDGPEISFVDELCGWVEQDTCNFDAWLDQTPQKPAISDVEETPKDVAKKCEVAMDECEYGCSQGYFDDYCTDEYYTDDYCAESYESEVAAKKQDEKIAAEPEEVAAAPENVVSDEAFLDDVGANEPFDIEKAVSERLGIAEYLGPATHDSVPQRSRTSSNFDTSIAAVAAAACAGTGVPFQHWTEPFAMVGSQFGVDNDQIDTFQQWWVEAAEKHAQREAAEVQASAEKEAALAVGAIAEEDNQVADADAATDPASVSTDDIAGIETDDIGHVPVVDFNGDVSEEELWARPDASATTATDEIADLDEADDSFLDGGDDANLAAVQAERAFQEELDQLANEEPVDIEEETLQVFGPDVLSPEIEQQPLVDIEAIANEESVDDAIPTESISAVKTDIDQVLRGETSPADDFVGSSPVICTIPEAYLPYDLAARDRDEGRLFSSSSQPFCVLSDEACPPPAKNVDWSPLASSVVEPPAVADDLADELAAEESESTTPQSNASPSNDDAEEEVAEKPDHVANELLEDLVWQAGQIFEKQFDRHQLSAQEIGRSLAALVVSGDRFVDQVAESLALVWSVEPQGNSPAGADLLARAQAVERIDSVESGQLADATATVLQWIDSARSAADSIGQDWQDITEVAQNPGTQDQPTRR